MSIRKHFINRHCEFKASGDSGRFTGYASVFGELDSYRDVVVAGAFDKTLQEDFDAKGRKVPMLWQHRSDSPIGIYTSLKEDRTGLLVEGECNLEVQQGRECFALMKQGALTGLSIGYVTEKSDWDEDEGVRTLREVRLWEISPVTFPAGDSARVSAVKSIGGIATIRDAEKFLRDEGFTRAEAEAFMVRMKAIASQGDPASGADAVRLKAALDNLRNIPKF